MKWLLLKIWTLWIEMLAFSALAMWILLNHARDHSLSGYQWLDAIIYGACLLYALYGFGRFAKRRMAARAAARA